MCSRFLPVCGQPKLNTKIVGGQDASPGSWPWQVSIQTGGSHFCGGSLINENWVLSAAHCFQRIRAASITLVLGVKSLEGVNPNMQQRSAKKIIINQNYNSSTSDNDIALVQLSSSVTINNYVLPVCLTTSNSFYPGDTKTWVNGFGKISSSVNLPSPKTLQEVEVLIVNNSRYAKLYPTSLITNNMICSGLFKGGKDSCQGDSGGPLVINVNRRWVQAGIVSFGNGCALPNYPGVYTRVSQYEDWIRVNSSPGFVASSISLGSPHLFCLLLSFSFLFSCSML
ncbi:serine protease 27-like [Clarias gariepinus]|uniref:serine protease 27-like n=1 Tax=Clarias gariepinus TaxID=13013 RepID=UPI00234C98C1|nr:serine protease 27-like [Clarias gariepinus]